jgi:putative thioredoxin
METTINVDQSNFDALVLQASAHGPVLVDFFATWCGPCQMLKPVLEKLAQEYAFTLAKVDIDQNPDLAKQYGVSGVPDVRIVLAGEVQKGFVGMLPEPAIRDLLHRLKLTSALDSTLAAIYQTASDGDVATATTQLEALLVEYPDNPGLVLEAANFYIEADDTDRAETLLGRIPQSEPELAARARGLQSLVQFKQAAQSEPLSELDKIYQQAAIAALAQDYDVALAGFLQIVERDRIYRQDAGRRGMLAIFDLLGNEHPLSTQYRKALMMALY